MVHYAHWDCHRVKIGIITMRKRESEKMKKKIGIVAVPVRIIFYLSGKILL